MARSGSDAAPKGTGDVRENEVIGEGNCLTVWSAARIKLMRHSSTTGRGCSGPDRRAAPYPRRALRHRRSRRLLRTVSWSVKPNET